MKTTFKFLLGFSFLLCMETRAQEAGKNSAIPSEKTASGRHELRKDKRVKHNEEHAEKVNEKKYESKSDKPFHKEEHRKAPKGQKKEDGEIINKQPDNK
jgi:hypothetical protein